MAGLQSQGLFWLTVLELGKPVALESVTEAAHQDGSERWSKRAWATAKKQIKRLRVRVPGDINVLLGSTSEESHHLPTAPLWE